MALDKLGASLYNALRKVFRAPIIDEKTVKELVKDIQRALLQADVNVQLVLELSNRIEKHALEEKLPPGISRREHVATVVYEELTRFLGEKSAKLPIEVGKINVLMLVGIQGSGKTTSAAKLARFFKKRGLKTALVCADTFRPGAYAQLRQLAEAAGVPIYGNENEKSSVKIALSGTEKFKNESYDVILIDTAGRHKDEKSLIEEMKELTKQVKPSELILVIDGTIGQQAYLQAKAFHEATKIGSIFVAKLDGSARGGGALSAVIATGAPIRFIGIGEKIDDVEPFDPPRFVGRLLGMGDLKSLVERVKEAETAIPERRTRAFLSGKFSLEDMFEQLESMQKMGSLKRLLKMVPGFGYNLPEAMVDVAEDKMRKWRFIIQSMTREEKADPHILNASRVRRIAYGAGVSEKDVKELAQQFFAMKKMVKKLLRQRTPLFGKLARGLS
jgi:signal recognition particle subunit SRP54